MTEIIISAFVAALIALYRIAHDKCQDSPRETAQRALEHGVKELERYYEKKDKKDEHR